MKKLLPILLLTKLALFSAETEPLHSSANIYYEMKDFSNSKQKSDGVAYGAGADIHYQNIGTRFVYEKAMTNTVQPPLKENLVNDKIFAKVAYEFNKTLALNINYIDVLHDNLVPTSGSFAYGAGVTYAPLKSLSANFTQYYVDYKIFHSYQSDLRVDYKSHLEKLHYKLSIIGKYIALKDKDKNGFSKNAQDDYTPVGLKVHAHYEGWHFGAGAYFGKRVFAIMSDGFKIQHHAMEFDRTYAVGIGRNLGDFVLRYQYIYQRATELPLANENVEVVNSRVTLNYKF